MRPIYEYTEVHRLLYKTTRHVDRQTATILNDSESDSWTQERSNVAASDRIESRLARARIGLGETPQNVRLGGLATDVAA